MNAEAHASPPPLCEIARQSNVRYYKHLLKH